MIDTRENCWEWDGRIDKKGYGRVTFEGKPQQLAHRVTWSEWFGEIPDGLCVLHHCDNPPCVNPWHLFLGTQADNNKDRDTKGRQVSPRGDAHYSRTRPELLARGEFWRLAHAGKMACGDKNGAYTHPEKVQRGEAHCSAKLTAADVREIRLLRADGVTFAALALRFGVRVNAVWLAAKGRTWKHVR